MEDIISKKCRKCGAVKPIEGFHRHEGCKGGRDPDCGVCRSELVGAWRSNNPEKVRQSKSKHYRANKLNYAEYSARRYDARKELVRDYHLRRKYGIGVEEYRGMIAKMGGVCICGRGVGKKDFAVDHDHKTGKIRGLLCGNCNTAIGLCGDDPGILRTLATYLESA